MLLSTSPQLIPGMSLSDCICLSCFPSIKAAEDGDEEELALVLAGEEVDREKADDILLTRRSLVVKMRL